MSLAVKKISLFSILAFTFSSLSFASTIKVEGSFIQKQEYSITRDASGIIDSTELITNFADVPSSVIKTMEFNPTSTENQSVVNVVDSFVDPDVAVDSTRATYFADLTGPDTPFTSELLDLVDFADYESVTDIRNIFVSQQSVLDLATNITDFGQDISFIFGTTRRTVIEDQEGTTNRSFIYFFQILFDLPRPTSEADFFDITPGSINDILTGFHGSNAIIVERLSMSQSRELNSGEFFRQSSSVTYVGNALVSMQVSSPSIVILFALSIALLIRRQLVRK
jgi:hypothetical protein